MPEEESLLTSKNIIYYYIVQILCDLPLIFSLTMFFYHVLRWSFHNLGLHLSQSLSLKDYKVAKSICVDLIVI